MLKHLSVVLLVVSVVLLAGCQPITIEEANAQVCADLEKFDAALGAVRALTPESTVEEAEEAFDLASDAWDDVANSAYELRDAKVDNLDQAYEDLDDSIRGLEEGDSIQDATTAIQTQMEVVDAAYDEFYNVQCGE